MVKKVLLPKMGINMLVNIRIVNKLVMVNSPGFIPYISKIVPETKIQLIPNGVITNDFINIIYKVCSLIRQHPCTNTSIIPKIDN